MEEKQERAGAACEMEMQRGRSSSESRAKAGQIQAGISEQTLVGSARPKYVQ